MAENWSLTPGETILRKDLQDQFGGRRQGGIGPSATSRNVLLFTDSKVGPQHGYVDSWKPDGCYHYTGEGQRGDQELKSGNAAVLNHKAQGRALRLFEGVGGLVTYIGRFEVDAPSPYYLTDAPETGGGPIRSVIVFRLRPIDATPGAETGNSVPPSPTDLVDHVPVEQNQTERFFVDPSREPYEAERREARLVADFCTFLERKGFHPKRLRIMPAGEAKPLFCDVYVADRGLMVEAKGSVNRASIRMALGQLLDYARFARVTERALLLPTAPRSDLAALIASAGVVVYTPSARKGDFDVSGTLT